MTEAAPTVELSIPVPVSSSCTANSERVSPVRGRHVIGHPLRPPPRTRRNRPAARPGPTPRWAGDVDAVDGPPVLVEVRAHARQRGASANCPSSSRSGARIGDCGRLIAVSTVTMPARSGRRSVRCRRLANPPSGRSSRRRGRQTAGQRAPKRWEKCPSRSPCCTRHW